MQQFSSWNLLGNRWPCRSNCVADKEDRRPWPGSAWNDREPCHHSIIHYNSFAFFEILNVLRPILNYSRFHEYWVNEPHSGTIEIGEQPLIRVAVERHGVLDAFHKILEFGADERIAGVSSIHVQPSVLCFSNGPCNNQIRTNQYLLRRFICISLNSSPISAKLSKDTQDVVPSVAETKKGTKPSALSSSIAFIHSKIAPIDHLNSIQIKNTTQFVLSKIGWMDWSRWKCYLGESVTTEAEVLIGVEDAQFDESDHCSFLNARVRLLGAVGDQLGQQHALFDERVQLFQLFDFLCTCRQQRHQYALTGRRLTKINIQKFV